MVTNIIDAWRLRYTHIGLDADFSRLSQLPNNLGGLCRSAGPTCLVTRPGTVEATML